MDALGSHGFAAAAGDGEPIWMGDALVEVKASAQQTGGGVSVLEFWSPPDSGPPLHLHTREDEWCWIVEGELGLWVGDKHFDVRAGGLAWCPRGLPHTYVVTSPEPARFLIVCEPGGLEGFVRAVGAPAGERVLPAPGSPTDHERTAEAARRFGIELLGPPGPPALE